MFRFDISDFPVELDILLSSYEGPAWFTQPFRHRSGWLMVAEARVMTAFGARNAVLAAAISDHGETYFPKVAARLLDLPMSIPRVAECSPPDALAEAMDMARWDFLGAIDLECLGLLTEAQEQLDKKIRDFEAEGSVLEARVWTAISGLRAERRSDISQIRRIEIDAQLARLLGISTELGLGMRQRTAELRLETNELERAVFEGLQASDELEWEHRTTIRWSARSRVSRRSDMWLPKVRESGLSGEETWTSGVEGRSLERLATMRIFRHERDDE